MKNRVATINRVTGEPFSLTPALSIVVRYLVSRYIRLFRLVACVSVN